MKNIRSTKFRVIYKEKIFGYETLDEKGWHYLITDESFAGEAGINTEHSGTISDEWFADNESDQKSNLIRDQFTGLLDKNGKEIFENDIIKSVYDETILLVSYEDSEKAGFIPFIYSGEDNQDSQWDQQDSREIIGNIHENPENIFTDEEKEKIVKNVDEILKNQTLDEITPSAAELAEIDEYLAELRGEKKS